MNKKVILPAAIVVALGLYLITPDTGTNVDVTSQQRVAPTGYDLSRMNNPVPEIEAKSLFGNKSFFQDMKNETPQGLYRYGLAFMQYLEEIRVRETIINGKPSIRFIDRNANNALVDLTPPGLISGLTYTGKTNFKRDKFDQLSYGALSEWLKETDPNKIGEMYFGAGYDSYTAFRLALIDFQRQIIVTKYKLNSMGFTYQSVSEEYIRMYNTYISDDRIPPAEDLATFEGMVMNNVKSISNFSGTTLSKNNKRESNNIALLLIEYFIYEDVRLLNSLKTEVKIITPISDDVRIEKRLLREQQEVKARERAAEENKKEELLRKRTGR